MNTCLGVCSGKLSCYYFIVEEWRELQLFNYELSLYFMNAFVMDENLHRKPNIQSLLSWRLAMLLKAKIKKKIHKLKSRKI